jgi:hypothetical protein
MATITVNGSNANVSFINAENIATIGTSSFNTTALAKNGGTGRLVIDINAALIGYGTVNSVKISYKAYGSRTGVLGSKAQIRTGYWNYNGGGYVDVNTHGDVGRGSSNATSYTDTIYPVLSSSGGFELSFKITNPIAAQTNTVYVSNISITIDYTPASYKVSTNVSPADSGTVKGGGTYNHGSTATLIATANDGYKFVKWNDENKNASRTITVTGNITYTAYFELDKINKIYVDTSQPTGIYVDETNKKIVFVVNGTVSTPNSSAFDMWDGYHIVVQNTIPSGMEEIREVYVDTTKVYG